MKHGRRLINFLLLIERKQVKIHIKAIKGEINLDCYVKLPDWL